MTTVPADAPLPSRRGRLGVWLAAPLLLLIGLYQRTVSRVLPPACRFTPSCSHYAAAALRQRSLPWALALTAWRLARCNPFCRGGHDPLPASGWPVRSAEASAHHGQAATRPSYGKH